MGDVISMEEYRQYFKNKRNKEESKQETPKEIMDKKIDFIVSEFNKGQRDPATESKYVKLMFKLFIEDEKEYNNLMGFEKGRKFIEWIMNLNETR